MKHVYNYDTKAGVTYGEFVRELFRPLPPAQMLAHAAMGVVTELRELLDASGETNAVEEAGDTAFFCAAFMQNLPALPEQTLEQLTDGVRGVVTQYCQLQGIQQNEITGGRAVDLVHWLSIEMLDGAKR